MPSVLRTAPSTVSDPREAPAYPLAEAARYLRLAPATLRSWATGREYPTRRGTGFFEPLLKLPDASTPVLSFWNLVEAHVLRSLRTEHGVSIKAVRESLEFAQKQYRIDRLLLSSELRAGAGDLFLERYTDLVELSKSGQFAMRRVLEAHLSRVRWDEQEAPVRLYPFTLSDRPEKTIVIDPFIAFGRPVVERKGISTATIADRIDAGETIEDLVADYDLEHDEIEEAIVYEKAA